MSTQESEVETIPNWHSRWGSTFRIGTHIENARDGKWVAVRTRAPIEMA